MKKSIFIASLLFGMLFTPSLNIDSNANSSPAYAEASMSDDDEWNQKFVNGYNQYGTYIHQLQVLFKYSNDRLYVKARLSGTSQDYQYAVYGPYENGTYKVNLGSVLYFDL